MKIVIETIPHGEQRYETCGDWWIDPDGTWQVRVSELGVDNLNFLIALHELTELAACRNVGITAEAVDEFDTDWRGDGEPGDDLLAPYWHQHQFASAVERLMAAELCVNWAEYERRVRALG